MSANIESHTHKCIYVCISHTHTTHTRMSANIESHTHINACIYTYVPTYPYSFVELCIALLQPIACGEPFLESQVSINYLVLCVFCATNCRKETS